MKDEDRISRRELLRGRFVGRMLRRAAAGKFEERPECDDADERAQHPPGHDPARPVMRYPRTAHDLDRAASVPSTRVPPGARASARRALPVLRPPGAIDEATFLAECTRCEDCIEACPHDAIVRAPARLRDAAGTPIIDASRRDRNPS